MNTVNLQGAEAVERAASKLESAADKMRDAAREIDFTLSNHQRFMNDWLERLQTTLEQVMPEEGSVFDVRVIPPEDEEEGRPTERPPAGGAER